MAAVRLPPQPPLLFFLFLFTPISFSLSDSDALLKFKNSFTNAESLSSWSSDSLPCKGKWVGVVCDHGIVDGLRLGKMGLAGKLDVEALQEMEGLRSISVIGNEFSGPIPEFNRLGALKAIYLTGNKFSGEIPSDYFTKMASLKKIWLSNNEFSGEIPMSLSKVPHLIELHLEDNQFSGKVPPLVQSDLSSFNISNNKLEGEVPPTLSKFGASSFQGNDGLCGMNSGKACTADGQTTSSGNSKGTNKVGETIALFIIVFVALVVVTIIVLKRRKDFDMLAKDNYDEPVEVYVASESHNKDMESGWKVSSQKGSQHSKGSHHSKGSQHGRGSHHGKNGMGDLEVVNDEKGIFGLPDLMKAAAEVLGNGGLGSAYKAVMANGVAVVVKRMREMNKLRKEEFAEEMRKLGSLRHHNILTPLAYHYQKEEKLMVSEYIPKGSLLYLLHGDRGPCHADLDWPARLKIVKGIAHGLDFLSNELSSYELPHGNLKSSNIFLGSDYEPLLFDYGFSEFVTPTQAAQALFAYKAPEVLLNQQVSPKCDVYCLGIVILEILTGKFPSQYLTNGKGGTDVVQWVLSAISEKREAELFDPEIADLKDSLSDMERLLHIGAACVEKDPSRRLEMQEVIKRIEGVQIHGSVDGTGIQLAVPTLRDGYADSSTSHSHISNVLQGYGEHSGRKSRQESLGGRNDDSFVFAIS